MGKTVQQLSEDRKRLCIVAESLYPSVQRRRADFLTLGKLAKAVRDNPQGIVAGMSMNNLYIETATELVSVFTLLNDAVAKGGTENMLTGAERSKTLWALNDKLSAFSRKLHLLYLSVRYYTLNDVWNSVTAGMIERNNGEVARTAMSRWRRAAAMTR